MKQTVAAVTAVWGEHYHFIPGWWQSLQGLARPADEIHVVSADSADEYPKPVALNKLIASLDADWIWVLDVDDRALPEALDGIDAVTEDVLLVGYATDEESYTPPTPPFPTRWNAIPAPCPFRRDKFLEVGGFPIVGFEDWGLWRRMISAGATFHPAENLAFYYSTQHDQSRRSMEFAAKRQEYREELMRECPLVPTM